MITVVKIYDAFICLGLEYADLVWDNCSERIYVWKIDVQK